MACRNATRTLLAHGVTFRDDTLEVMGSELNFDSLREELNNTAKLRKKVIDGVIYASVYDALDHFSDAKNPTVAWLNMAAEFPEPFHNRMRRRKSFFPTASSHRPRNVIAVKPSQ